MKIKVLLLTLLLPLTSWAQSSLQDLRKIYFTRLDYHNQKILKLIPNFEKELVTNAESILKNEQLNQEDALILVYTSMYIRNTSDAVAAGLLDLAVIPTLSNGAVGKEADAVFASRELYRIRLLEEALKVIPDDKLVQGFKLGAEIWYEKFTQKTVSKKLIKSMMDLAKKEPIPNIFSALIVANEITLSVEEQARIDKLRKKALNKFRLGLLHRSDRPHDETPLAFNGKAYAPFAQQAARVILADSTLKAAMSLTGFPRGYNATFALKTYQSLFKEKTSEKTEQWPNKNILVKRIETTQEFLNSGKKPAIDNEETRKLYSCASCHSTE